MTQSDILNSLWIEKYRPKELSQVSLDVDSREKFKGYMREGIIPNLLFEGGPGSGKTTCARILISMMDVEELVMNASDERGIDVVRGKIKNFAKMATSHKFKLVFLDEFDKMTEDAQDALRAMMETFCKNVRFILCCNYLNKITEPIISRVQTVHFNAFPKNEMKDVLVGILKNEKMEFNEKDVDKHIEKFYPDLRKAINEMQLSIRSGKFVYIDKGELYKQIASMILAKNLKGIREELASSSVDYGQLYRFFYDNITLFPDKAKLSVLLEAAEYLYRDSQIVDKEMNFAAFTIKVFGAL
jgi:replication factor C small subunit